MGHHRTALMRCIHPIPTNIPSPIFSGPKWLCLKIGYPWLPPNPMVNHHVHEHVPSFFPSQKLPCGKDAPFCPRSQGQEYCRVPGSGGWHVEGRAANSGVPWHPGGTNRCGKPMVSYGVLGNWPIDTVKGVPSERVWLGYDLGVVLYLLGRYLA